MALTPELRAGIPGGPGGPGGPGTLTASNENKRWLIIWLRNDSGGIHWFDVTSTLLRGGTISKILQTKFHLFFKMPSGT